MDIDLRFFRKANVFLFGAIFVFFNGFAQQFTTNPLSSSTPDILTTYNEKCAHPIWLQKAESEMGYFGSRPFFENWIENKIELRKQQPQILSRLNAEPRLIPVVVHVIHNGQPVGQGTNIPDSQIIDQIRILNEDYNRQNEDASRTPEEFLPVAAAANIQFVLAKQDPSGLPTDGILRVHGPKTSYDPESEAALISQQSRWNPDEYLNMYVAPLISPYIGYASFPVSDLPGLNFPAVSALTDGTIIDYRYFGSSGSAIPSSLGRTATHEIGHFFGLRHIWGDGGCGIDDFVTDTPEQDNSNNVCNANPSRFSCNSNDMIQNYMDYTPDACMNLFTLGQIERFNIVLANSPRRATLVNNRATKEPKLVPNDLAISKVTEPGEFICSPTLIPKIEVLNAGSDQISSGKVELRENGTLVETKQFGLSLATGDAAEISFNELTLQGGNTTLEFRIVEVDGTSDSQASNNTKTVNPALQQSVDLPFTSTLSGFPGPWTIDNPDGLKTWEKTNLTISGNPQDLLVLRNFEYEAIGQLDYFITPIIDLAKYPNAQMVFEVAYGPYNEDGLDDKLYVAVSGDCGNSFDLANAPYSKSGQQLHTAEGSVNEFIPTEDSQFRTELVDLAEFAGMGNIRLGIISESAYGNSIYLRNIRILPNEAFNYDISLNRLVSPGPIVSSTYESEVLEISNTGNLQFSKFLLSRTINDNPRETFIVSGAMVDPGEVVNLATENTTSKGKNKLVHQVSEPNFDQNSTDINELTRYLIQDDQTLKVPWRQDFDNASDLSPWHTINPEFDKEAWGVTSILNTGEGVNRAAVLQSTEPEHSYWLGTPIFDLGSSSQASIFFDLAAGQVGPSTQLTLMVSEDAGENYQAAWTLSGAGIATVSTGEADPSRPGDYVRKYVNLSEFAGAGQNRVRLAFVVQGGKAGDSPIYLDNIELFLNANPNPVIPAEGMISLYPNPAREIFNIAFNLPSYEDVTIQVISVTGALVQDIVYPNTLNQTYSFSTELFSKGVFIVKISGNSIRETKRLIIN